MVKIEEYSTNNNTNNNTESGYKHLNSIAVYSSSAKNQEYIKCKLKVIYIIGISIILQKLVKLIIRRNIFPKKVLRLTARL